MGVPEPEEKLQKATMRNTLLDEKLEYKLEDGDVEQSTQQVDSIRGFCRFVRQPKAQLHDTVVVRNTLHEEKLQEAPGEWQQCGPSGEYGTLTVVSLAAPRAQPLAVGPPPGAWLEGGLGAECKGQASAQGAAAG